MTRRNRLFAIIMAIALIGTMFCVTACATEDAAVLLSAPADSAAVTVDVDGEIYEYDLADADSAHEYVDNYADNLTNDANFKTNIETAIAKVRESIGKYATVWALIPPLSLLFLLLSPRKFILLSSSV